MVVVFVKDMLSKVDYDCDIAFVTDYMIADEDSQALQSYFEANAEDLNGDGEVTDVQIQNYVLPPDDAQGYDPQMLAAGQTKMTVDLQEGTSMIFFISQQNFEKFKDAGVFPEKLEDFAKGGGLCCLCRDGRTCVREGSICGNAQPGRDQDGEE